MDSLGKLLSILTKLFNRLFELVTMTLTFIFQHLFVSLIVLIIVGLLLTGYSRTSGKRQQRKSEKRTNKVYRKEAAKQNKAVQKDLHNLANSCYRIIEMLNERISVESNKTNLLYIRDQYQILWEQIRRNQPVTNTPQELLDLYLQDNNDTTSRLYAEMENLTRQYWALVN